MKRQASKDEHRRARTSRGQKERRLLVRLLDQGFDHAAWHGPTLAGALRGVSARAAAWRPAPGRHNIWELVLHTAYWKYAVRQRLGGGKRGSFPRRGANWPALPDLLDEQRWKADLRLLHEQHLALRRVAAAFPVARLGRKLEKRRWTASEIMHGIAMHDLYHAGQIQLLKRLGARR